MPPYVSISAFLATFIRLFVNDLWASQEPLLKVSGNRVSQIYLSICLSFSAVVPYFVVAFVRKSNLVRRLFSDVLIFHPLRIAPPLVIYHFLHRKVKEYSRLAFHIGHFVEKLKVLTLIFLHKSAISVLYEAGDLVLHKDFSISRIHLTVIGSTASVYSLQKLYKKVDNNILQSGVHARCYSQYMGTAWTPLLSP